MKKIDPARIERAARMYSNNQDASQALGIAAGSFSRLCRAYGVETPHARRRRQRRECRRLHMHQRMQSACRSDQETEFPGGEREWEGMGDMEAELRSMP